MNQLTFRNPAHYITYQTGVSPSVVSRAHFVNN